MNNHISNVVRRSAHTLAVTYVETYLVFFVLRLLAPSSVHTMVLVAALTASVLSFAYTRISTALRRLAALYRTRPIVVHIHLTDTTLAVRPAKHPTPQPE